MEIGGGIRSLDTIQKYLDAGVSRVILGTAAVTDPKFLERALDRFGSQAAVGVDLKDGAIAIKGWKETAPERGALTYTEVIAPQYEAAGLFDDGLAPVKQNGKWGYVDETGTPVTEFVYEPLLSSDTFSREALVPYSAHEGLIPVMKDGKCGVIDTQGNEVVPCIFDGITSVYDGAVWAKQNGQWGVLNVA